MCWLVSGFAMVDEVNMGFVFYMLHHTVCNIDCHDSLYGSIDEPLSRTKQKRWPTWNPLLSQKIWVPSRELRYPTSEKETHLQTYFGWGYVTSQEGISAEACFPPTVLTPTELGATCAPSQQESEFQWCAAQCSSIWVFPRIGVGRWAPQIINSNRVFPYFTIHFRGNFPTPNFGGPPISAIRVYHILTSKMNPKGRFFFVCKGSFSWWPTDSHVGVDRYMIRTTYDLTRFISKDCHSKYLVAKSSLIFFPAKQLFPEALGIQNKDSGCDFVVCFGCRTSPEELLCYYVSCSCSVAKNIWHATSWCTTKDFTT